MPVAEASQRTRVETYVYAITWADEAMPQREGVADAAVVPLVHGKLAALVSDVDAAAVRARRRDLVRHSDVVIEAGRHATVLPVGFGTVFRSPDSLVDELLAPRHDELVTLLRNVEGLVEVTIRALYREEQIIGEIARSDDRIARLRGRAGAELELGRVVSETLGARRAADRDAILRRVRPLVHDVVVEEPQSELEVLRAAFLVDHQVLPELDQELDAIAATAGDSISFKYVGPLPAFHFANLSGGG